MVFIILCTTTATTAISSLYAVLVIKTVDGVSFFNLVVSAAKLMVVAVVVMVVKVR